ncbi:hypothetical protein K474DRAFT_1711512 [Panus rudis PR-1116 ss-1]|nr:hypothetical protein K474DRAFT_1711512 [Panus rudis PR-1116 ss-1]
MASPATPPALSATTSSSVGRPSAVRSNSLVSTASSVASSNSAASSLRRRSRTRTRTLNPSSRRGKSAGPSESGADSEDGRSVRGGDDAPPPVPSLNPTDTASAPRASMSGKRAEFVSSHLQVLRPAGRERAHSTVHVRDLPGERGRQTRSENGSVRGVKTRARGMSVPRHVLFKAPESSDSSGQPSPRTPDDLPASTVRVFEGDRQHIRDSVFSHISSTSSSLYPPSTSSGSRAESSLFPPSLRDSDNEVSSFAPRIVTAEDKDMEFDIDDVQYRLRLLVKNSYFLPPAHSKPTPISLAPPPAQKPAKANAPNFLGLFGLGKSKSKPTSPAAINSPMDAFPGGPVLRTTSDSANPVRPHAHSMPTSPLVTPFTHTHTNPTSRVVVLREKMDDLATAAKQAEKDIKTKVDVRRGAKSQTTPQRDYFDDVIDPTDAVDLPPPSQGYPFAVQASMAHGLPIQDSVGADVLADKLPPSPGMWSMSSEEDSWRKALLHEAVSHSLHSTPDNSFASPPPPPNNDNLPDSRPESQSFRDSVIESSSGETPMSSTPKPVKIGQPILDPREVEELSLQLSPISVASGLSPPHSPWNAGSHLHHMDAPNRAETPAMTHALAPPPRRTAGPGSSVNAPGILQRARSQTDVSQPSEADEEKIAQIRRVRSSPRMSAVQLVEAEVGSSVEGILDLKTLEDMRGPLVLTPPPSNFPRRNVSYTTTNTTSSGGGMRSSGTGIGTNQTSSFSRSLSETHERERYSDDNLSYSTPFEDIADVVSRERRSTRRGEGEQGEQPRPSLTISVHTEDRPSLSESNYSHPSPTISAFQDAVFGSCRSPSPLLRRSHPPSPVVVPQDAPVPSTAQTQPSSQRHERDDARSPPPRASSSLGPANLPVPPRSPAIRPVYRPSTSSGVSNASERSSSTHSSATPLPLPLNSSSSSVSRPHTTEKYVPRSRSASRSPSASRPHTAEGSYQPQQSQQQRQAQSQTQRLAHMPSSSTFSTSISGYASASGSLSPSLSNPASSPTRSEYRMSAGASASLMSLAERRGLTHSHAHASNLSLTLRIPTENFPCVVHSAPAPASPTDFFDRIQSGPNAMDDLETTDDESSSEGEEEGESEDGGEGVGGGETSEVGTGVEEALEGLEGLDLARSMSSFSLSSNSRTGSGSVGRRSSNLSVPPRLSMSSGVYKKAAQQGPRARVFSTSSTPSSGRGIGRKASSGISITKLGNFSTPQLSPSPGLDKTFHPHPLSPSRLPLPTRLPLNTNVPFTSNKPSPAHSNKSSTYSTQSSSYTSYDIYDRQPVANIPEKGTFFTSKKKGGNVMPFVLPGERELAMGLHRRPSHRTVDGEPGTSASHARDGDVGEDGREGAGRTRRPYTADATGKPKAWQRESLQKFDGMLLQHIAAEREAIKKITGNFSPVKGPSSQSHSHSHPHQLQQSSSSSERK